MRASYGQIEELVRACGEVQGDFAEFGVWQGETFLPLAEAAQAFGKRAHAVDSFQGCGEPGPNDYEPDGSCEYPAGALSTGGSQAFRDLVRPLDGTVEVWEGWIPAILAEMVGQVRALAFVHVDLDQYGPTLWTLRWCWPRMSPGGILCCHDWFPEYRRLAAGAIRDWILADGMVPAGTSANRHIWFRK